MSASCVRVLMGVMVACLLTNVASALNMETVPVGNAGNAADTTGYGSVGYNYRIGKYEVTAGQYCEFLNKVGGIDTHGLYNTEMANTSYGSGITRSGGGIMSNPYTYSVASDRANRPVNYVSYWDACRFTNWLHNGQPIGTQGADTTETGAYTLTIDGMNNNTVTRNADWKWAVTSEDEWYKAAYHKNDGVTGNYFDYPTSSDGINAGMANYDWSVGHTTDVGFYACSSPYGTFDQGGNVDEWHDTRFYDFWYSDRGVRGGSFGHGNVALQASDSWHYHASYEDSFIGFRVVEVPEPASLSLLSIGGLALIRRKRR